MSQFETIINAIRNILRNEGITGMDSINHCVAFAILRYMNLERCKHFDIPEKYAFENFLIDDKTNELYPNNDCRILTKFYSKDADEDDFLSQLRMKFNFTQLSFKINSPFNFVAIVKKIGEIDFNEIHEEYDIVGMIYEIHLKTGTSNSMRDLGQYFTHRKVIKFMIELCRPTLKPNGEIETILDPSMGSGGFLSMSIKYLNKTFPNINWKLNKTNMYGFDIDENVRNLSLLNSLLESGEVFDKNIVKNDTLRFDYKLDNNTIIENVDIILANEPFGLKGIKYKECCKRIKDLKIEGTKSEPLFLQLMLKSLNKNGRCAVIVPDGVLFNEANLHLGTRKYLIEHLNLKKVISLGDKMFLNTGVKSSILFFVNDGKTIETEFSEIKLNDGVIKETSVISVNYDILKANNYYLCINKYTKPEEIKHEGVKYMKLKDVCDVINGYAFKSSDYTNNGNINIITIKNIDDEVNIDNCNKILSNDQYKKYEIVKNDILMSLTGNIKIGIYNKNECAYLNQRVIKFKNFKNIYNKYIFYYIKYKLIDVIQNNATGSIQCNISSEFIMNLEIPIPSIEIQKRIVEILDAHHNKIESNKKVIEQCETLKKSFVTMHTMGCETKKLGELCEFKSGKLTSGAITDDGNIPFYNGVANPNFKSNQESFDGNDYILMIKDGGAGKGNYGNNIGLGKVFYVTGKVGCTTSVVCIKNKINCNENNKYIYYYLSSIKNNIMDLAQYGVGLGHISIEKISNIQIPVPSIEEQNEIIKQCEYYDQQIDYFTKENKQLESNNVIEKILSSLSVATEQKQDEQLNEVSDDSNEIDENVTNNDKTDIVEISKVSKPKKITKKNIDDDNKMDTNDIGKVAKPKKTTKKNVDDDNKINTSDVIKVTKTKRTTIKN